MTSPITAADYLGAVPVTAIDEPDDGNDVMAADLRQTAAALLANDDYIINDATDGLAAKVNRAGDTFTGAVIFSDSATFDDPVIVNDNFEANSTSQFSATVTATSASTVLLLGRKSLRRARVTVTDASQTINVTQGDRFELPANNAAPRTITLKSTAPAIPNTSECVEFLWTPGVAGGAGTQYTFQREDTTVVATFVGSAIANTGAVWAEFEFAGGVWRLGHSSGTPYDGTGSYGVVAGAGA